MDRRREHRRSRSSHRRREYELDGRNHKRHGEIRKREKSPLRTNSFPDRISHQAFERNYDSSSRRSRTPSASSHKAYIFSDSWHHRPKSVMNSGFENIEEKYSNDIAKSKMRSSPISNNLSDLNEIRHENRRHRKSPNAFNKFKHNFYDREQYKRMSQLEIERHFSSVKKHSGDTNVFTDNRSYTNSSRGDSIEHQKTIYSHSLSDIRNSEQPDRAIYPFDVHYSMNDIQGIMDHLDKMIAGSSRDNSQVASLGSRDDYLTSMNREIGWIADASRRMENESLLPSSSRSKINWRKAPSSLNENSRKFEYDVHPYSGTSREQFLSINRGQYFPEFRSENASFNVNNTLTPLSRDQLLKARGLLQELLLTVTGSNSAVQVDNRFDVGSQSYSCGGIQPALQRSDHFNEPAQYVYPGTQNNNLDRDTQHRWNRQSPSSLSRL